MDKPISILFCGDVFISPKTVSASISLELQSLFNKCDLVSINLEAPITTCRSKIEKAGPCIYQSDKCVSLLKEWGVTLVNCANNHIMDYGEVALNETLNSLSEFVVFGAGMNFEQAYQLKKVILNNRTIGFLSFAEAGYGMIANDSFFEAGYAWINHDAVNEIIRRSALECDYLLVQVHAGVEEINIPLPEWRARYKELVDLGASAVICSHPHVPQGVEVYKDAPIFYSLGNFFFEFPVANNTERSFVAELLMQDNKIEYFVYPIEKINSSVSFCTDYSYRSYLKCLNEYLLEPLYTQMLEENINILWEDRYKSMLLNSFNGIERFSVIRILKIIKRLFCRTTINYVLFHHLLFIESHFWTINRALLQKRKK